MVLQKCHGPEGSIPTLVLTRSTGGGISEGIGALVCGNVDGGAEYEGSERVGMHFSFGARMNRISRRELLKRGGACVGALAIPSIIPAAARGAAGVLAPSDRVNVGLIGRGLMGNGHLHRLTGDRSFQVMAVCDVDPIRREEGRAYVNATYAADRASGTYSGCAGYNDYRDLLARPDIDAVVIVTPDHWHSLQSIDAAMAGKDVYCEKPISVTISEGRQLAQAMRRYMRVFQTGTQYRSIPAIRRVCRFVRGGGLGKIKSVFTLLDPLNGFIRQERFRPYFAFIDPDKNGASYAPLDFHLPAEEPPAGLDWQMWVGPAPWHPYNKLFHINPSPGVVPWSFCDAFGVAALTWHLAHSADVIQYAIGMEESGPVELIHPSAGVYPTLTCRYANGTLLHFVDHWGIVRDVYKAVPKNARLAGNFGGIFVGERGWVTSMSTGGPVEGSPEEIFREMGMASREVVIGANDHHANWLSCIHSRKRTSCDEEIGHRSASLGHLAMICYTLRRSLKWDPVKEEFIGDEAANRLRGRALREPWQM